MVRKGLFCITLTVKCPFWAFAWVVTGVFVGGGWFVACLWLVCGMVVSGVCHFGAFVWHGRGLGVAWWLLCVGGNQRTDLDSVYEVGQDGFVMVCFVEIKQAFLGEDCPIIDLPK